MRNTPGYVTRKGRVLGIFYKHAPKAPPAPKYADAATKTAESGAAAAQGALNANRADQNTPYGSIKWTHAGSDPNLGWTQNQTLAPDQQALLAQQNKTSLGLGELESQGLGYVTSALQHPITAAGLPANQVNAGQTGQDALMARYQPMIDQSNRSLNTDLANQGIYAGAGENSAYNNAWRTQNQANNDLRSQAALNGISVGENAQNQQLQLQTALQNQPLNILNSVRTGAQVTNPTFSNYAQMQTPAGANYLGAAQAQGSYAQGLYNSKMGQYNANGGWFGPIGGATLSLAQSAAGSL